MVGTAAKFIADRQVRDAAKSAFDTHLAAFKTDLNTRGVGGRMADEMLERAKVVGNEAVNIVEEHPVALGGTMLTAMLWFFREPILEVSSNLIAEVRDRVS